MLIFTSDDIWTITLNSEINRLNGEIEQRAKMLSEISDRRKIDEQKAAKRIIQQQLEGL
jgi:hypothetical protein